MATFTENFDRANSNTVGGGWSEIELAPDDVIISGNRLLFNDANNGATIHQTRSVGYGRNNTTVLVTYEPVSSVLSKPFLVSVSGDGTSRSGPGASAHGLHIALDNTNVYLYDGATLKSTVAHGLTMSGIPYYIRWDIKTDYSMKVYISTSTIFTSGNLTVNQAAFTPASSDGGKWEINANGNNNGTTYVNDFIVYDSVQALIEPDFVSADTDDVPELSGTSTNPNADTFTKQGFVFDTSSHSSYPGNVAPGSTSYADYVEETISSTGALTFTIPTGPLVKSTTYYVRAYVYNSTNSTYYYSTSEETFTTGAITFGTTTFTETTETAFAASSVTNTGGEVITKRGFVYDDATHTDPGNTAPASTAYPQYVEETGTYGADSFDLYLVSHPEDTTVYVRPFIQSASGYVYGAEVTFSSANLPNLYRWYPNGEGTINSVQQLANQGNVYTIVKILPPQSHVKTLTLYCAPTSSSGSTVIATLKIYLNQASTPIMTKSITQALASRGYVTFDINRHNVNSVQLEIEYNTTDVLGSNDLLLSMGILEYEPTTTHTPDKG